MGEDAANSRLELGRSGAVSDSWVRPSTFAMVRSPLYCTFWAKEPCTPELGVVSALSG